MNRLLVLLFLLSLVSGCNLMYRPEMRQGNLITDESLANLKAGLSKRQVRLVLGSPSISDPFHPDRWEYVYSLGRAGDAPGTPPRLTLYFSNDQLVRAAGDLAPSTLRYEVPSVPTPPEESAEVN